MCELQGTLTLFLFMTEVKLHLIFISNFLLSQAL